MTTDPNTRGADDPVFASEVQAARRNRELITALARRRTAKQLTQADIADRMRTSQSAVARLETHQHDAQLSTLARYVTALGLSLGFTLFEQETGEVTWASELAAKPDGIADQGAPPGASGGNRRSIGTRSAASGRRIRHPAASADEPGNPSQRWLSPVRTHEDPNHGGIAGTAALAKTWEDDEPAVSPFGGSPTILRTLLGAQLKRLREARRLSLDEAAHTIRSSHSKISRLEAGRVRFKDRDLADLLSYYGVTDEVERQAIRDLATRANARDWWHDYSDILPSWFQTYVGLEETAIQIRAYEDHFVHGLLQTPDYARAVTQIGYPDSPDHELERRVALRLARQAILTRPTPPFVWVILDESVLRRPIGGTDVLRAQIKHLAEMAERPHVAIQIMPLEAGGHAAAGGSFSVLRFAETDLPDVVYLEQLTSALYLDKQEVLDHYQEVMNRLSTHAMTPAASLKAMKAACRR